MIFVQTDRPHIFLNSGELYVALEPSRVSTILGSCVAVTLYCEPAGLAAICHAMLPEPGHDKWARGGVEEPFRYVSLVVPAMIEEFAARGIPARWIEAKLFGGADTIGVRHRLETIGAGNVARAAHILTEAKIKICRSSVGGGQGRKLHFDTETGVVLVANIRGANLS
jgi:chemotaxis protein CheD